MKHSKQLYSWTDYETMDQLKREDSQSLLLVILRPFVVVLHLILDILYI